GLGGVPAHWPVGGKLEIRCEGGGLPVAVTAEGVIVWRRGDTAGVAFTDLPDAAVPVIGDYVAGNVDEHGDNAPKR
ncbi:MAG: hypothetical protein HY216_08185, partial [Candidatus Rokubacteria bacterium]|nr:hypothetical protein [Candidatus Rokubacteria bacterium]